MKITTIGIDLAKEVFQIHGVDEHGKVVLHKRLSRGKITKFFANIETLPDRYGSLRQLTPLGEKAVRIWTYDQTHVTAIPKTLR